VTSVIVTFYSYKGGVGRTMALANLAIILAKLGKRVLAVDLDLEAPGLDRYFTTLNVSPSRNGLGMIDLLLDASKAETTLPDWHDYMSSVYVDGVNISLITAGAHNADYVSKVSEFKWRPFFEESEGGDFIESLRNAWREEFDFTLVDSRTGITEAGGVCTIQLPDILVPVFTCTDQSLHGAIDVAYRAKRGRQQLAFDRQQLLVFPLASRFDGRTEFKEAQQWLDRFGYTLAPFYRDWLPKQFSPRDVVERTKLPYVAFFSFGEKLPVVTHRTSDPESLGYAYETVGKILANHFGEVETLLGNVPNRKSESSDATSQSVEDPYREDPYRMVERALIRANGAPAVQDEIREWIGLLPKLKGDSLGDARRLFDLAIMELTRTSPNVEFCYDLRTRAEAQLSSQPFLTRGLLTIIGRSTLTAASVGLAACVLVSFWVFLFVGSFEGRSYVFSKYPSLDQSCMLAIFGGIVSISIRLRQFARLPVSRAVSIFFSCLLRPFVAIPLPFIFWTLFPQIWYPMLYWAFHLRNDQIETLFELLSFIGGFSERLVFDVTRNSG
jgi:MinD-like ATPase involved in chromosome partitioning or flagellar assembly